MPLIVIGASAGGLAPLEDFFSAAPSDAGWCYVVIQHLSPDHRSLMGELLGRKSGLTIRHIEDGVTLQSDTLYLNTANCLTWLEGDTFRVQPFDPGETLPHRPIDAMFLSLAERNTENTFAVVLSGSGSDGMKGAQTFHAVGGKVIVQSPKEATFGSMPSSVLNSGTADRVVMAGEIPGAVRACLEDGGGENMTGMSVDRNTAQSILELLERQHHVDFSAYKSQNVLRRIERRQHLRGLATIEEYRDLLASSPAALDELYQDLLIGVTEFYRDPEAIAVLREKALDPLVANSTEESSLRIWVPACASGEEAYTIAIELSEAMRTAGVERKFRIIATDVHRGSIDMASAGIFAASALEKVPSAIRERYFSRHRDRFVIDPVLRQTIIFSVHDVLSDPPFMQLDVISCRNLMIYLNDDAQLRVISMFLFGLRRSGYLLLGPSESLGRYAQEFQVLNGRWRLFRNASNKRTLDRAILSSSRARTARSDLNLPERSLPKPGQPDAVSMDVGARPDRDNLIKSYDALLKRYAPSSILITPDGNVLAWFGTAGAYIDTMNNLADWTVEDIVHPDLHFAISVGIERLRQGHLDTYERSVDLDMGNGERHRLIVHVEALEPYTGSRFLLVGLKREDKEALGRDTLGETFAKTATPSEDQPLLTRRIRELERDLRLTEETLQHITERLEASGEELQASNEELQASNEELQASNEELHSSNEELHAVNEELLSVSSEHERKIEMLSELNRDTELILEVLKVGVIALDRGQRIRRFSRLVGDAFKLEAHDVDRTLGVVGPRPDFVNLDHLVQQVLETGKADSHTGEYEGADLTIQAVPFERDVDETREAGVILIFSGEGFFS